MKLHTGRILPLMLILAACGGDVPAPLPGAAGVFGRCSA